MSQQQSSLPLKGASAGVHPLDDLSPMPFGKYTGTPLQDVPVTYLHWLWTKGLKDDSASRVSEYIRRNLHALQAENDDLIWE